MHTITVTVEDSGIGMMSKAIKQRGDAGSIGEDLIPFFEWSIRCDNNRTLFVSTVDDFVEKIGCVIVVGKIGQLINAQQMRLGIGLDSTPPVTRRVIPGQLMRIRPGRSHMSEVG